MRPRTGRDGHGGRRSDQPFPWSQKMCLDESPGGRRSLFLQCCSPRAQGSALGWGGRAGPAVPPWRGQAQQPTAQRVSWVWAGPCHTMWSQSWRANLSVHPAPDSSTCHTADPQITGWSSLPGTCPGGPRESGCPSAHLPPPQPRSRLPSRGQVPRERDLTLHAQSYGEN